VIIVCVGDADDRVEPPIGKGNVFYTPVFEVREQEVQEQEGDTCTRCAIARTKARAWRASERDTHREGLGVARECSGYAQRRVGRSARVFGIRARHERPLRTRLALPTRPRVCLRSPCSPGSRSRQPPKRARWKSAYLADLVVAVHDERSVAPLRNWDASSRQDAKTPRI
jgi:hypothetical protein